MARSVYWDSCCFIGLINKEKGRHGDLRAIYEAAEGGELVIVTSTLTFSEVCKVRCDEGSGQPRNKMSEDGDSYLDVFFDNDFFWPIEVSTSIAIQARKLFRRHREIGIVNDAIHLATALAENVDEMHTYDGNDLLGLSGKIMTANGDPLVIRPPKPFQGNLMTHEPEGTS